MADNTRKRSSSTNRTGNKRKTTAKKSASKKPASKKSASGKKTSVHNTEFYNEIFLVIGIALSLLLMLSSFGLIGKLGEIINTITFGMLGVSAYLFPFMLFIVVFILVANNGNALAKKKTVYSFIFLCLISSLIQLFFYDEETKAIDFFMECAKSKQQGGFIGALVTGFLYPLIGFWGTFIVLVAFLIIMFILISEKLIVTGIAKKSINVIKSIKEDYDNSEYEYDDSVLAEYDDYDYRNSRRARKPAKTFKFDSEDEKTIEDASLPQKKKKSTKTKKVPKGMTEFTSDQPDKMELNVHTIEKNEAEYDNSDKPYTVDKNTGEIYENELRAKFRKKTEGLSDNKTTKIETKDQKDSDFQETKNIKTIPDIHKDVQNDTEIDISKRVNVKGIQKNINEVSNEEVNEVESLRTDNSGEQYQYPPLDLLSKPKSSKKSGNSEDHYDTARKLESTLGSFGVKVTVTDISVGPTVTRYEMQPEQGVKVSRITNLADDIKLNLAATDIRIEAPIPGKAAVGIEVPNKETTAVNFRELLETNEFKNSSAKLAFAVGKDLAGMPVVTDIAKMPHLLIAGQTGSGKSVCINTLIMSILYKYHPDDVKMIMVDPKVVELSVYNGVPHLLIPVVTEPKKASGALNWAVAEMVDRYNKFAQLGVRDMTSYNKRIEAVENSEETPYVKMPQIVIIVDELADLMMVAPGEVEDAICRLAQMARAAGIHLVIATQRPSVNVITGLIKANVPSRIAFSVASATDSRTILDGGGAEKLLGKGDMLFYPAGYPKPVRLQGAFISDSEVSAVVDFLSDNNKNDYSDEVIERIETASAQSVLQEDALANPADDKDQYFEQAGKFIIEKEKASIGMLQRVYKIGFNRAARIMDQLADAGVVGPEEGTKPRKVLMTMEEFEQFINGNAQ